MEFLRRGLSLLLAAVLIVGMLPVHGHALEIAIEEEPAISRKPTETQTEPETEPVPETAAPPASVPEQTLPPETAAPETTAPEQTLPAQTLPQQTEPETQTGTDSWINPIYRDSLTEEDLLPFRHGTAALSDTMNNSVAEAAADLRAQLTRRAVQVSTRVRLPESKDSMNLLYEVFTKALEHTGVGNEGDYLRFHYGGWSGESEQTVPSGGYYEITLSYTVTWYTTPEQEEWMDTAVAERLAEMDLDGKTEYEKIRTIYFWLCENVGYDWDNLDDETYKLKYTAYAALANGRAVCQGYATLMYRMMLEAGIDCRVITGDAGERHAWNIVELENEYYNMDATWDRGATDWHRHFLCTQDNFSDHIRDSEYNTSSFHAAYPMAKVPYVVNVAASGTLSNGMRWTLNADTQELTVSGTGAMPDFPQWDPPWDPYRDGVKTITLSEGITAVGRRAFVFCKNCTQVNLPSTLRVIREYGFNNLRALTQITLPEGLTQLDFCAFSECAALKSITIPGSVRTFGSSIFSNCPSLESVTFAEGMTRIPDSMFSSASSLKEVNFPSTLVEIGDTAFIWCNGLQEVTIPASVTSLGDSAFGSCQGMQNIFVEEGNPIVKDIDGVLFSKDGKTLLTFPAGRRGTYTVPDGVTTIDGAFTRAKYITDVIIPDSVTVLGGYSFTWCDSLTNVTIGPNVVSTGEQCFGFCANLRTATFLGETTSVGNSCFSNCKQLTSVTLPARATSIGYSAFYECNRLTSINIPETVRSIGSGCFQDCDRLTAVTVPANVGLIDYCMFYECPQLTQLEILGNISKIDRHAISGCTQLRFLRLGGTLGTVHSNAFENTDNLTAIYLDHPSMASQITSVNSYNGMVNDARSIAVAWNAPAVSSYITNNYRNMQTVVYNQRMYKLYSDHSCSWQLEDFTNGLGTRSCTICGAKNQYHYGNHTYVASVTAPTCTEQGYTLHTCTICGYCYQFSFVNALGHHYQNDYCTRCGEKDVLASGWCGWDLYWELNHSGRLRIEGSDYMEDYSAGNAPWYPYRDQITTVEFATWGYPTTIGDYAFYGCENLTTVTLPENLIYVGNSAFRDCSTLQDVNLGQGLMNIEDYAFYGCTSLTQIDIPETVSEIGPSAFENCSGLNVVILHSGLYQIGAGAFRNCTSLPSITIPSGISRLDDEAFADCTGLETVFFEGQAPALGIDVFRNVTATIYYPAGDETWEEYAQSGGTVTWKPNCHGSHTEAADAAVPPTCTEPGLTEGSHCSVCGDILTAQEEIPALGHDWDAGVVTSEPTEEADGIRTYTCSRCRETRTEVIPALEHVHRYEDTVTAPTCTEQGYTTHTCRCGDSYTDTYVEPTGHSYGSWTVTTAPTCTETGEERRDCENCDHFETREASMIAHTETIDPAVPPTCTETGLTEGSHCAVCQAVLTEQETVPATGHSYGDWVVTSAPTCTETGEEQRHCDHCSHFESRELDIIDHREVEDAAVPPTCTEPGLTEGSHCADCQTVLTAQEVIPATGHSYGIWQVTAAPTCTQDGGERRDCENCGHSETRILEAFGHTEVTDAAVSPTCTEPGLTAGSHCSVCETVLVEQEEIPALGHSYGDWEMTAAPTCTGTGEERRDCENCDHFETREIAATGHSYEAVVTAPTCTERGYTTHTCHCGDSYVDSYVDATGHSYGDWTVTTAPTCTETGTERRDCEACDHFENREVAANGHTEVTDTAVPATCTEPGLTEGSHCSVCGTVLVAQEEIPALGHDWDEGVVTREPTEETEGERTYTCERCGETRVETIPTLDHVHSYEVVVTAPTCTEQGYTTHTCRCGDSYVDTYVEATGHSYGDWTVTTTPTCTETGTERRDCENCDHFETREVAATGHTEVTDAAVPATCTEPGLTEGSHCSVCNTVLVAQEEIPALGHAWDEGVVTKEPTEETEGEKTYTCDRCGETKTEVIPTLDHVHSYEAVVTAPTCTERGYTTHTCRCGDSYVDSYVDATGHSHGDWTVTTAPTCTETGTERRDCENCDHFETRVVAATGHSYEAVVTAPTCTERGYTTHICHCDDSYVDSYVDATGHNYGDWTVTTAPTCTETGTERRDCENCDHFETRVVAATGHSYEAVVTAPTCTERGYTTHTCRCGDSYVDTYVPALGHREVEDAEIPATCTESGLTAGKHCSVCQETLEGREVIPALGHDYETGTEGIVCQVCGDEMYLRIFREYIATIVGQNLSLTAQISPEELADKIRWSVDDRNVLSVDRNGNVTARNVGTAYVIATVTDGDITLTDRCRVDVTEEMVIEGIQLSTNKLNVERYSADYATVDVLLKLPQNYSAQSVGTRTELPDLGVSIEAARFTDDRIAELFTLGILDDRTLSIIPTEKGMNEAKGKYTGTVTVTVAGTEYESEAITLTVKNTLPKLKATISNFNSFYTGQSQEIQITGATVTNITATSLPNWLTLDENKLTLTGTDIAKNASGKAVLQVETEEWNIPAAITLNVRNSYKAPGLKLSATSVNMSADSVNSNGAQLKLIPNNKKDTLESLKVTGIATSNGYVVENFNIADGTFTLKATESAVPGKIVISVSFADTDETLALNLTVKNTAVTLKLSTTNVTLNPDIGDAAKIIVTATPADYRVTNPTFRLEDSKKNDKLDSGELALNFANGTITVSTTDKTPNGATYKLYISAGGSREVSATIKTVEKAPSMTLKATGSIDISFPENEVVVTPNFKNYSGAAIEDWEYSVAEMKGKNVLNANAGEFFEVTKEGTTFHVRCVEPEQLTMGNTYQMTLKLTLPNGSICENTVKLTIRQTALKLKLSATNITLNKTVSDSAELTVTSTTKGYTLGTPVWQLMDKTGKNSAEGKLDFAYNNGKLTVSVNEATEYAATYKLLVKASEKATATTLTVNIPAQNRSAITGTIKLVGGIDVIRDGSSVTVTPTYKNCGANAEREERIEIYSSADKYTEPVTNLFDITRNADGTFTVTKSGAVDHTLKYQAKLVTDFGNGVIIESKLTSLKVTMGTAKLTANADSETMFAKDKNCRVSFTVTSTDNALNKVKTVEIKDKKYQNILEVIPYGNGEFAIGYKEGKVDSSLIGKTVTLNLNVFLEGNESTKVNGTVRLKLIFTK